MESRIGTQSAPSGSGFENTLNDVREVKIFRQFQSSSAIQDILPGCEVQTEYQVEKCSWKVRSADYLNSLLVVRDGSTEGCKGLQSWNDVLKLIKDAEDHYLEKGKANWFRRNLRQGEDVAAVLQNLTEMIPDEYGLGVLRGGLSMLFTAWRDRIKNRERIFSALSDIPTVLCVALQKWRFFQSDEQLWDAIKQLLDDSIDAIRSLIEILVPNNSRPNSWKKRIMHSIPDREARMIEQIIDMVNSAMKNVETHIERLDRTRAAETHFYVKSIDAKADDIQETLSGTNDILVATNTRTQETIREEHKHIEDFITSKIDDLKQDFQKQMMGGYGLIPQHMEYMKMVENYHTSFYHVVIEEIYKRSLQPTPAVAVLEPAIQPYTTDLPAERLIELMAIQSLSPYQDRDTVLLKGHTMSPVFLGRGRYILTTPQFQQLSSAPSSGVLLVDGDFQNECDGKVSPISVFCASLAATLAYNPALMVLHFFAGQHSFPDNDPARGPRGLMRSLIYQVLLYPNQPSSGLDQVREQAVQDIADGAIDALCWLFRELLKRVVNVTTILCIVDNVSDFETKYEGWVEELMRVFDWFRTVPDELSQGINFKLLMTSARKSTELVYKTDASEHLSLVAGNVMNVGKSEWAMAQDIGNSVPPQDTYWREGPEYW